MKPNPRRMQAVHWTLAVNGLPLQTKLMVNHAGDAFEQEADRVAALVMRVPDPAQAGARRCACGGIADQTGECPACRVKRLGLMRKSDAVGGKEAPASVHATLQGTGQPLDAAARSFMEARFGLDFGAVRVHTDSQAAESARSVQAQAYTVGQNIVFGVGRYAPESETGQRLLAHELAHVVQQSGVGGGPQLVARAPLDLRQLDEELFWGDPLTQTRGEIGFGAASGPRNDPPTEDSSLPIEAVVYPNNTLSSPLAAGPAGSTGAVPGTASGTATGTVPVPASGTTSESAAPTTTPRTVTGQPNRADWRFNRFGLLTPARIALVVSGVHGNERGPLDVMRQLQSELANATSPLARDFNVVVIPVMNPGGVADGTRENRRGVDLNRNFPGLSGFPAPAPGVRVPPEQPEVRAVRRVIEILQPARILALHAISGSGKGGVYADPVEDRTARELACRMALRMRGVPVPGGGMSGAVNAAGNELANGVCNVRYPEAAAVSVTTAQSSLGSWASAPTTAGGRGIPVITHEVSGKSPLAASGSGRSVDTIMPGIREFLLDNERSPSEADAMLRQAVSDAYLIGQGATSADTNLLAAVTRIVNARFADMNAYYRAVWRPRQPGNGAGLPQTLTKASDFRSFTDQRRITTGALSRQALFQAASSDDQIRQAILNVMQTISVPGFSRHHWGTEIDVVSATRTDWEGNGRLIGLIPFLRDEASRFGFFHPFSDQRPSATLPHYQNEPWHISYWPIANVLQQEWASRFTGAVLDNLIARTAQAIHGAIDTARMERILRSIGLENFQTNVAPSL